MGNFKIIENLDKSFKGKHYIKERELSTLEFNTRVLDLAADENIPVIERLNFIKIVISNLDEFISIKLPECKNREHANYMMYIENLYNIMEDLMINILQTSKINIAETYEEEKTVSHFFADGAIYYVYLNSTGNFNIVPLSISKNDTIEKIKVLENMNEIKKSFMIRFVSDKTFTYVYTGENIGDLLKEIKMMAKIKENSVFNYIQTTCNDPDMMNKFLTDTGLDLDGYLYMGELLMQLPRLMTRINSANNDEGMRYPQFNPEYHRYDYEIELLNHDILVYNPYQSYAHVTDFIDQICMSPNIQTIFSTLYRTSENSIIADSLIKAKQLGKSVYVYVELTARGNEERNVALIERLMSFGIHVSCNYYNYKVHAKMFCAVTNEGKVYTHIGTGNYNEDTAKLYTDLHLLTTNTKVTLPVLEVFKCIFMKKIYFPENLDNDTLLYTSPINLREELLRCIDREIKKGEQGRIYIKCNSLCDLQVIDKLYEASNVGVDIKLMIRTACSILPTDNIEVRSKIGRFLEHDRIYIFGTEMFISSADLLLRNINKRVEILCKISDDAIKMRLLDIFFGVWQDDYVYSVSRDFKWHPTK